MAALLVLGAGLILAGNLIYRRGQFVIERLTSRSLGNLAPGYAGTPDGIRAYAVLIICIGMAIGSLGVASWDWRVGTAGFAAGVLGFIVFSIVAIVGEVRTYRALQH